METVKKIDEPVADDWIERAATSSTGESGVGGDLEFFRLSGGILKSRARTSNRIDDLLRKLVEDDGSSRYMSNVDKNLDYLYTYLQLDMIGRVGRDVSEMSKRRSEMAFEGSPDDQTSPEE